MIKKIEVISIPVKNQDKAVEFYINKLGFKLLVDTPFDQNKRWIQIGLSDENETTISLVDWFEDMLPVHVKGLVLSVDDIEKTVKNLKENGVGISPIDETPWGKFAHFNDIDGNGWAIREE